MFCHCLEIISCAKFTGMSIVLLFNCLIIQLFLHLLQFIWRSQLLGALFTCGGLIILHNVNCFILFGWYQYPLKYHNFSPKNIFLLPRYMCIMTFFHFSEFIVTSVIRPQNLSTDSFLLNHSKAYGIAASVSWLEYLIELWLFPCK
jgi:protein-S-isoprenylcysteine O-methyltransferase